MAAVRIPLSLLALAAAAPLAACGTWAGPVGAIAGAGLASVAVIQRTPGDLVASVVTGRDCSLVRLDKQQSYCKPPETTPRTPYCTHSLGVVDCWIDPQNIALTPRQVEDSPALTALQEQDRRRSWLERQLGF